MYFLEASHIVKQYAAHRALDDVNIRVPQGRIFGLLGPNGAGKTTLLRIINRITAPDSGEIRFNGHLSRPEDVFQIGYLPEEQGLYKKMKVGEQAIYLSQLKGLSYEEARKRVIRWFEKFDIMPWWNRKVEELSKGMQQKVQFITTVVHEPALLIFDEPFSGFDPVNTERLKQEILELKAAGHTLIFSTHQMASVEEICDEIALIDHSRVVLAGAIAEVRNRYKSDTFTIRIRRDASPLPSRPTPISPAYPDETAARGLVSAPAFPATAPENELYTLLGEKELPGITELHLKKKPGVTPTDLIVHLARQYELLSFAEELPSMHDIFIRTVSAADNTLVHE